MITSNSVSNLKDPLSTIYACCLVAESGWFEESAGVMAMRDGHVYVSLAMSIVLLPLNYGLMDRAKVVAGA